MNIKWIGPCLIIITSLLSAFAQEIDWAEQKPCEQDLQGQPISRVEMKGRIEYTNKHFSAAGIQGSRLDRGLVYIALGPPDKIRNPQPSPPGGDGLPLEVWEYRSVPGIGTDVCIEFLDTTLNHKYKIIPYSETAKGIRRFKLIQQRMLQVSEATRELHDETSH